MRARCLRVLATGAALGIALLAGRAHAEERRGVLVFPELGVSSFTSEEGLERQAGFRAASLSPNNVSADFAFSALLLPAIILTPDLDIALPVALGQDVRLVPRIGVSGLLVAGGDVLGYAFGPNVGIGLVVNATGPVVFRTDYTVRMLGVDEAALMNSISVGLGW
jgi:hypothetical protein